MAKVENNIVVAGLSGTIGHQLVFSQRNGKTIVGQAPHKKKTASEKQEEHRKHFKAATIFAKSVVSNPETKAAYEKKAGAGQSAYNVAVADYMTPPIIDGVDLNGYDGTTGSVIRVCAEDVFEVKDVHVSVADAQGQVIEEGEAVKQSDGLWWNFTATHELSAVHDAVVSVCIHDIPGNEAEVQVVM